MPTKKLPSRRPPTMDELTRATDREAMARDLSAAVMHSPDAPFVADVMFYDPATKRMVAKGQVGVRPPDPYVPPPPPPAPLPFVLPPPPAGPPSASAR